MKKKILLEKDECISVRVECISVRKMLDIRLLDARY